MFYNCSSLTSLKLADFNTENVENMKAMFYNCSSLTFIDLSNFTIENVNDMENIFSNCSSLKKSEIICYDKELYHKFEN